MFKAMSKPALLVASLLALQACTSSDVISLQTTGSVEPDNLSANGYSLANQVHAQDAFIKLDGIASPVNIQQSYYANGASQEIILPARSSAYGENAIFARFVTRKKLYNDQMDTLRPYGHDVRALQSMFKEQFPGRQFNISPQIVSNRYGGFGYSHFAISKNVSCLFAWQQVRAKKAGSRKLSNRMNRSKNPMAGSVISYRIRYCSNMFPLSAAIDLMQSVRIDIRQTALRRDQENYWISQQDGNGDAYFNGLSSSGYISRKQAESPNFTPPKPHRSAPQTVKRRKKKIRRSKAAEMRSNKPVVIVPRPGATTLPPQYQEADKIVLNKPVRSSNAAVRVPMP